MRGHEREHFSSLQAEKAEAELTGWLAGRLPAEWCTEPPEVTVDREEILIVGTLPDVDLGNEAGEEAVGAARAGRVQQFRALLSDFEEPVLERHEH